MTQELTVVVTGSTGKQGGAVARGLLKRGHRVRAVTRDPTQARRSRSRTPERNSLRRRSKTRGDQEGARRSDLSLRDDDAVRRYGYRDTTRCRAADAAKAAGVHLVFTSVGSANRQTGIPHFDSKYEVEKHIAKVGVRATILAPVAFMENLWFAKEQLAKGIYATALSPTRAHAQIAVSDIGEVAVRVLEDAGRFAGKRFDLASDELTGNEALAILSRVNRPLLLLLPGPARCHPPAHG